LSAWRSYVLLGGGAFAIEIASYLVDCLSASGQTDSPAQVFAIVSDVVAQGSCRLDDIARVTGQRPQVHESLRSVEQLGEKLAIVCIGDPRARWDVFREAAESGIEMGTVIHPTALVSATAKVGRGAIVCPFAFIGPFASIGDNSAVNVHAMIGHDAVLEHSSVVSPGAQVNGFGRIGVASFVGAGAVLHPRSQLGAHSKLSAGSVLTKSVGDGFVMHGNPAGGRQMIAVPVGEGA
jgi:sugar O-acyltransferase (sialic acid O-acetyltransferase NeuD family)